MVEFTRDTEDRLTTTEENVINECIRRDFCGILPLTAEDEQRETYKALKFTLYYNHCPIIFKKIGIIKINEGIGESVYLIAFRRTEQTDLLIRNPVHRNVGGNFRGFPEPNCIAYMNIQFILMEFEEFRVWSYMPVCGIQHEHCPYQARSFELRRHLF